MCKRCSVLLQGLATNHTDMECPLRRSLHCCICLTKGHSHLDCPNTVAKALRKGLTVKRAPVECRVSDDREKLKEFLKKNVTKHPPSQLPWMRAKVYDYAYTQTPPQMVIFKKDMDTE